MTPARAAFAGWQRTRPSSHAARVAFVGVGDLRVVGAATLAAGAVIAFAMLREPTPVPAPAATEPV